jgi:hypothetical protein
VLTVPTAHASQGAGNLLHFGNELPPADSICDRDVKHSRKASKESLFSVEVEQLVDDDDLCWVYTGQTTFGV